MPNKIVVGAYFPWWGTPDGPTGGWAHWRSDNGIRQYLHTPSELYDSRDPSIHSMITSAAKAYGVDAFAASWWGKDSAEDANLQRLLDGTALPVCLHFEAPGILDKSKDLMQELQYALGKYADHPMYLRNEGRPVVFVYNPDPHSWQQILSSEEISAYNGYYIGDNLGDLSAEVFDGLYAFGPQNWYLQGQLLNAYRYGEAQAHSRGKLWAATLMCGYDDTIIRTPATVLQRGPDVLTDFVSVAVETSADWMFVTSIDEWHEGSEFYPSVEHGEQYALQLKDGIAYWKGL